MKISYTKQFINTIDSLLVDEYNQITRREDFLALLAKIELLMNFDENEMAWFEYHKMRKYFGQVTISVSSPQFEVPSIFSQNEEERITIMQDEAVSVPIVGVNSNQNEAGHTKELSYFSKKKRVWKLVLLLKILEDRNIIYRTSYDRKLGKTRRYFYSSFFELECQESEIEIVKEELSEKYCQLFIKEAKAPKKHHLKVQYDLLKSKRFQIDTNAALKWIDDQYYNERTITSNQKRNYTRMVLALEDKFIFTIEGENTGRIFTNFNSIKKELRQFCTIDGQKLMSIDLKSSQPYLMAQYMKKHWPTESKSFYDTVTKDDIYLFFLKKWNEENPSGFYREYNVVKNKMEDVYLNTRDDIKPEYLKMMFKVRGRKPALEGVFKREFPFVYEKIQEQKKGLAALLQKEESYLFIPVCTEFAERGCLSIHDSLVYKAELKDAIIEKLSIKFKEKDYRDFTFS